MSDEIGLMQQCIQGFMTRRAALYNEKRTIDRKISICDNLIRDVQAELDILLSDKQIEEAEIGNLFQ